MRGLLWESHSGMMRPFTNVLLGEQTTFGNVAFVYRRIPGTRLSLRYDRRMKNFAGEREV